MVLSLNGIIFDQLYGDNTSGAEFDTDYDGTATQEDEFVSFTNTTGSAVDVSGWQVWTIGTTGSGAPDSQQEGLYHTFGVGTQIAAGDTLYVLNELSSNLYWATEASEGGIESTPGGLSTNLLPEGVASNSSRDIEAYALVDPVTGDYIVFDLGSRNRQSNNAACNINNKPHNQSHKRTRASNAQADLMSNFI